MDYLTCKQVFFKEKKCIEEGQFHILDVILSIIVSVFAFVLSWNCNTARNLPFMIKLFYGSFAFIFGSLYVVFYILFNLGTCKDNLFIK